jgi:ribosomal protein L37E
VRHKACEDSRRTGARGEGFSSPRAVARIVRIVYCHACGAVSTNVFGERDICTSCGNPAERMTYRRPWQSYVSGAILIVTAAVFIWGPITDTLTRAAIFAGVLVVSAALANWGLALTRRRVLAEVARRKVTEEKA